MKINKIYIPFLFFSCVALGIVIGGWINYPGAPSYTKKDYRTKLNRLLNFIENEYVDDVKTDSIVATTVNTILANLDPHSVYVTPKEQLLLADNMNGDFVGIGINFYIHNDTIAVIKPIENGPAAKAGIQEGDRVLYANNTALFGKKLNTEELYNQLRGAPNTAVTLTVYRKATQKKFTTKVVRARIPIKSVVVATLLNPKTGYIKIERFAATTATEFHSALLRLKQKGIASLVIDLRENGGGVMESAVAIADEFLKKNELIVFTKNKKGTVEKTFATEKGLFEHGKVTLLIDENSASASEILAGAIQDNDRGLIIGRRSFGKGLVQREMQFEDGSAVRITVARYFTPSGRSIQKPYQKGDKENYFKEHEDRFESGELVEKDKIKTTDTLKFTTKKGRIVYGGGGIVPDIFVPTERAHGEESLVYILNSGIMGHFVFEQLDTTRKNYAGLSYTQFLSKIAKEDYLNSFEKYLANSGVHLQLSQNKSLVNRFVQAEFAKQLYGDVYYYQLLLKADPMIQKIIKK